MVEIVLYDKCHKESIHDLVVQFHDEALGEFGLEARYVDIDSYEETHGPSTFVMLEEGRVIGVLSGQVTTQPMSDIKVYQESLWYVHKDHRKYGIKLMRHLEKWCAENDVKQIVMTYVHNSMPEKVCDFYKRLGYVTMETNLIKDVN